MRVQLFQNLKKNLIQHGKDFQCQTTKPSTRLNVLLNAMSVRQKCCFKAVIFNPTEVH